MLLFSCKKDDVVSTDPSLRLSFSTDTVWFDTVFVQSGANKPASVTKRLWVYNPNADAVNVNIALKGNIWGIFKLNIDGKPGNTAVNKMIRGKDSIIIFVQMYVDSNGATDPKKPFIVFDEIDFTTNGNMQLVNIAGYARKANYLRNQVLDCATNNLHWTADLPYVIYDSILVPSGCTLTIDAGTHIYSHTKSCFLVAGTLIVNGTSDNPVIFEGDRMEPDYTETPGQWIGIRFFPDSKDNVIKGAVIKNGLVGIELDSASLNQNPKLVISQSKIQNMYAIGIAAFSSRLVGINNLVSNCGQFTFYGVLGGDYFLYHNTFATFGNTFSRTTRTFVLDNSPFTDINGNTIAAFPLNATLINNIIYGNQDEELTLNNNATGGNTTGHQSFQNCLIKTTDFAVILNTHGNIINKDPMFNDVNKDDYDLQNTSPVKVAGINVNVSIDLKGRNRNSSTPSMGCYE